MECGLRGRSALVMCPAVKRVGTDLIDGFENFSGGELYRGRKGQGDLNTEIARASVAFVAAGSLATSSSSIIRRPIV